MVFGARNLKYSVRGASALGQDALHEKLAEPTESVLFDPGFKAEAPFRRTSPER